MEQNKSSHNEHEKLRDVTLMRKLLVDCRWGFLGANALAFILCLGTDRLTDRLLIILLINLLFLYALLITFSHVLRNKFHL